MVNFGTSPRRKIPGYASEKTRWLIGMPFICEIYFTSHTIAVTYTDDVLQTEVLHTFAARIS